MRRPLMAAAVLAALCALPAAGHAQHAHGAPDMVMLHDDSVPLWPGVRENVHLPVRTSPAAQQYFDQGVALVYGFNHPEAILSFRRAAAIDTACAMCWWGVALAYGPNINTPLNADRERSADSAVVKAMARVNRAGVTPYEKALVSAIRSRYGQPTSDTAVHRRRDEAYAAAMREVVRTWPQGSRWAGERHLNEVLNHVQTLYSESLLDLHPWDQWELDGRPKWNTPEVLANLDQVIGRDPMHVGACHLNIHAREASQEPATALPCARRLEGLMPWAGHIVHMPSHIYERVGTYDSAVDHNARAVQRDSTFIAFRGGEGRYPLYFAHNREFMWTAATNNGQFRKALEQSTAVSSIITEPILQQYPWAEHFLISRLLVLTRYGQYDQVLREGPPNPRRRSATGMWRYAQAVALARRGNPVSAKVEADSLERIWMQTGPDVAYGINSARTILGLALRTARGEIAAAAGDTREATRLLAEAAAAQDSLRYDEPSPFYYPVRHSLGAVLLGRGMNAEAEAVYREDLRRNPENGWSLLGLSQALQRQGKTAEANAVLVRFRGAWSRADPDFRDPPGSRY
jgi:tetratricopeptide (TPR) repeat protein